MGQSFSSGNSLHLQLDKPFYYSGDHVTGKLYVNVVSKVSIKNLHFKAKGQEYTKYYRRETYSNGKAGTTSRYVPVVDKKTIFKVVVPLLVKGELEPGNYEFPMNFKLAPDLPSSFDFLGSYNSRDAISAIYYTIKAELDVQGIFSKDPKTKAGFQLLQRPSGVQAMPLHAQEQADITGCCCISKGAVMVQADAATNIVRAGDTLGVTVQVENNSKVEVLSVQLIMEQCASIRDHITLSRTLASQHFPGLASGTSRTGASAFTAMLPLPVDQGMRATSMGQITRMWYQVRVDAETKGCCTDNAHLKAPVALEDPMPQVQAAPVQPPPGWSPMVFPEFKFSSFNDHPCTPLGYTECVPAAAAAVR